MDLEDRKKEITEIVKDAKNLIVRNQEYEAAATLRNIERIIIKSTTDEQVEHARQLLVSFLEYHKEKKGKEPITPKPLSAEVPNEIMEGLFRIMCGIPSGFANHEVYDEARPGMLAAKEFIIYYGVENGVDMRGESLRDKNNE